MLKYIIFITFIITLSTQIFVPIDELEFVIFRNNATVCIDSFRTKELYLDTDGIPYAQWRAITPFDYNLNILSRICQQSDHIVKQLRCVNGTANCDNYSDKIKHVDCYNVGITNNAIDWQCEAEIDEYDPVVIDIISIDCKKAYDLKRGKVMIDEKSCRLIYRLNNDIMSRKKTIYAASKTDIAVQWDFLYFLMAVLCVIVFMCCKK